jgi:hypothetical protein
MGAIFMWVFEWVAIGIITAIILSKMTAILQQIELLKTEIVDLRTQLFKKNHSVEEKKAVVIPVQEKTNVELVAAIVEAVVEKPVVVAPAPAPAPVAAPVVVKQAVPSVPLVVKQAVKVSPKIVAEPVVKRSFEETYGGYCFVFCGLFLGEIFHRKRHFNRKTADGFRLFVWAFYAYGG